MKKPIAFILSVFCLCGLVSCAEPSAELLQPEATPHMATMEAKRRSGRDFFSMFFMMLVILCFG